jgi:hypothetical protein
MGCLVFFFVFFGFLVKNMGLFPYLLGKEKTPKETTPKGPAPAPHLEGPPGPPPDNRQQHEGRGRKKRPPQVCPPGHSHRRARTEPAVGHRSEVVEAAIVASTYQLSITILIIVSIGTRPNKNRRTYSQKKKRKKQEKEERKEWLVVK